MKKFKVKLQTLDPLGDVVKTEKLSMYINDDKNSMIYNGERLLVSIGDYSYFVDKNTGKILDQAIKKECSKSPNGKHKYVSAPDSFDNPYCKYCYDGS